MAYDREEIVKTTPICHTLIETHPTDMDDHDTILDEQGYPIYIPYVTRLFDSENVNHYIKKSKSNSELHLTIKETETTSSQVSKGLLNHRDSKHLPVYQKRASPLEIDLDNETPKMQKSSYPPSREQKNCSNQIRHNSEPSKSTSKCIKNHMDSMTLPMYKKRLLTFQTEDKTSKSSTNKQTKIPVLTKENRKLHKSTERTKCQYKDNLPVNNALSANELLLRTPMDPTKKETIEIKKRYSSLENLPSHRIKNISNVAPSLSAPTADRFRKKPVCSRVTPQYSGENRQKVPPSGNQKGKLSTDYRLQSEEKLNNNSPVKYFKTHKDYFDPSTDRHSWAMWRCGITDNLLQDFDDAKCGSNSRMHKDKMAGAFSNGQMLSCDRETSTTHDRLGRLMQVNNDHSHHLTDSKYIKYGIPRIEHLRRV